MGDDEILQLFFHRVEYAISAVEEKYGRLCRSVARGILKDERDVEECVNDTCMRAWNAIPPEKPRSLEAYLVRITRNLALDRYAYHHSQKRETALTEAYDQDWKNYNYMILDGHVIAICGTGDTCRAWAIDIADESVVELDTRGGNAITITPEYECNDYIVGLLANQTGKVEEYYISKEDFYRSNYDAAFR